jgi:HEAT repeat protein
LDHIYNDSAWLLRSDNPLDRALEARTLGIVGQERAVPPLTLMLHDKVDYVVKDARNALDKLRDKQAGGANVVKDK